MRSFRWDVLSLVVVDCHPGWRFRTIGRSPLECVYTSDNVRASPCGPSCPKTRPPPIVGTELEAWFPGKSDGPWLHSGDDPSGSWKILDQFIRHTLEIISSRGLMIVRVLAKFVPREKYGISIPPSKLHQLMDWVITFIRFHRFLYIPSRQSQS